MSVRSEGELGVAMADAYDLASRADNDLREMRYLTSDEVRAYMRDQLSAEKAAIRRAISADRIYVVAGSGVRRVHFYDCPSLSAHIDRDRAWSSWLHGDPEDFRRGVAHGDGGPRMPELLDRDAVEALRTYVTCQTCSPTLSHTRKSLTDRTTKLINLAQRHIGRPIAGLNGNSLGQVERIITTIDREGSSVRVETSTHSLTEQDSPAVIVGPPAS